MAAKGTFCSKMLAPLLIVMLSAQISVSSAFLSTNPSSIRSTHVVDHRDIRGTSSSRYAADNDSGNGDSEHPKEDGLALPPIGASSFWDRPQDEDTNVNAFENSDLALPKSGKNPKKNGIVISKHAHLVSPKFQLQYTCKICSYRNSHTVTRMAYRKGVVIAMCKGCQTKHWIADHLGWSNHVGGFDFDNGERDIEMYMENRDHEAREKCAYPEKENDLVRRVNQDVFDLENAFYKVQEGNVLSATEADEGDPNEDGKGWS
eukprot:CAMPEP_0172553714 /NCGR_PEP_ID=MMETSP1067-20121228/51389_1 /TAXON_ID=265564 ORGANISM="Thalassiosira punctigera, Strain Tpunct2005C2" /NCGR_SAMPLE_ID=MMETSP1067 /ASSEMBLY_ACC=CAM_ASM_000444 /LENGTH=260 /DNA_ID=CAMNT_0013341937 /DNA_START=121 /DNA_END=903 /DNA_ORIENTATION=+